MQKTCSAFVAATVLVFAATLAVAAPARPKIVTAEAVWADVARQIGGDRTLVASSAVRPSASTFSGATIVILTGAGYDPAALALAKRANPQPKLLQAAEFSASQGERNPYVWNDLGAVSGLARALAAELGAEDPPGRPLYERNLATFESSVERIAATVKSLARVYRGSEVFVTDGLYQRMLNALGFAIYDRELAEGAFHGAALTRKVAALSNDIGERKASILIYDAEHHASAITQLVALAKESDVPAVGVRETKPAGLSYQEWMIRELNAVHGALNEASP